MTVSEELRQWAVYDRRADVNKLPYSAWLAWEDFLNVHEWVRTHKTDELRTFALLVACALED